jgi:lipopolysaccharide transport system permease protein
MLEANRTKDSAAEAKHDALAMPAFDGEVAHDERRRPLSDVGAREITRIFPEQGIGSEYLKDLRNSFQLIRVLVNRDIRVRYKQTILGVAWIILQPLMTVAVYSFLFGYIARIPSEGVPYPLFLLVALLPWQFLARLVSEGAASITSNANLVGKVYFPRLILPIAVVGSLLMDLLVGLGVALIALIACGYYPGPAFFALPFIILFAIASGLAVVLIIAPLDVHYRDIRLVIPIVLQIVMFMSPIFYPPSVIPQSVRWIFEMNPIAVIAVGVRWSLLGTSPPPSPTSVAGALFIVVPMLCLGLTLFVRAEARFADKI